MTEEQKLIVEVTTRLLEATVRATGQPARTLHTGYDVRRCVDMAKEVIELAKK